MSAVDSYIQMPSDGSGKKLHAMKVAVSGDYWYEEVVYVASGTVSLSIVSGNLGVSGAVSLLSGQGMANVALYGVNTSGNMALLHTDASGQLSVEVTVGDVVAVVSGLVGVSSGEVHIISGTMGVGVISGLVAIQSGYVSATVSGSVQVSGTVQISGLVGIQSGLVAIQSGFVSAIVSGNVGVSGTVNVHSGVVTVIGIVDTAVTSGSVIVSGNVGVSGTVSVQSGIVTIVTPTAIYSITSGNPLKLNSESGGIALVSKSCRSVSVKSIGTNSGEVYIGGSAVGDMPYSGQGYLLEVGESISIEIDNIGKVRGFASVSGDRLTYVAVG